MGMILDCHYSNSNHRWPMYRYTPHNTYWHCTNRMFRLNNAFACRNYHCHTNHRNVPTNTHWALNRRPRYHDTYRFYSNTNNLYFHPMNMDTKTHNHGPYPHPGNTHCWPTYRYTPHNMYWHCTNHMIHCNKPCVCRNYHCHTNHRNAPTSTHWVANRRPRYHNMYRSYNNCLYWYCPNQNWGTTLDIC